MLALGTVVYILSHSVTGMFSLLGLHMFTPIVLGNLGALGTQLNGFISSVTNILSGLGAGVAVIGIIVGGLMRATAFGNERKVAISNQAIACAIVGLAIVLVAQTAATGIQSLFH